MVIDRTIEEAGGGIGDLNDKVRCRRNPGEGTSAKVLTRRRERSLSNVVRPGDDKLDGISSVCGDGVGIENQSSYSDGDHEIICTHKACSQKDSGCDD